MMLCPASRKKFLLVRSSCQPQQGLFTGFAYENYSFQNVKPLSPLPRHDILSFHCLKSRNFFLHEMCTYPSWFFFFASFSTSRHHEAQASKTSLECLSWEMEFFQMVLISLLHGHGKLRRAFLCLRMGNCL